MNNLRPFHLAIQVHSLDEARGFYGELMKCPEGRSDQGWVDFNFFGHQLVCHLGREPPAERPNRHSSAVDGHDVPVPHFGLVLAMPEWEELAKRLRAADVEFVIEPYVRFKGQPGEQATLFLRDPSGNALEFKAFRDMEMQLFAK